MSGRSLNQIFAGILVGIFSLLPYLIRRYRRRVISASPSSSVCPSPSDSFHQTPPNKQRPLSKPNLPPPPSQYLNPNDVRGSPQLNLDQVEILLHNVSHTDMVLSIPDSLYQGAGESIIARPKFSCFREISTKIETKIRDIKLEHLSTIKHPVYARDTDALYRIIRSLTTEQELDVGFDLQNLNVVIDRTEQLRFRQNDRDKMSNPDQSSPTLSAVYFPLLSMLIPKWLTEVDSRGKGESRKIVFLVSGQGTPRDETARVQDNSTETTARVMEIFLKKVYPSLEVIQITSPSSNLFRYADNIVFVKQTLKPKLDEIRNALAAKIGERWLENLHVTMSFADGSSARISAISAAIRSYRPSYMHFWQLKTFWYETKICMDDIECHSYDEISTSPPVLIDTMDDRIKMVVEEMQRFKEEFKEIRRLGIGEHDLGTFWLRKTKKPVLAVLLVQKFGTDEPPKLYRGTNMEVSMPTGSLCAERNVIGTALASDLTLRREDIRHVAVLSLSLKPNTASVVCSECDPNDVAILGESFDAPRSPLSLQSETATLQVSSYSETSSSLNELPVRPADMKRAMSHPVVCTPHLSHKPSSGSTTPNKTKMVTVFDVPNQPTFETPIQQSGGRSRSRESSSQQVLREEKLQSSGRKEGSMIRSRDSIRSSLRQLPLNRIAVEESMNPLKPCGACHEWLKKIAEVNPSFSVITFTDSECQGVYVEQIDMM